MKAQNFFLSHACDKTYYHPLKFITKLIFAFLLIVLKQNEKKGCSLTQAVHHLFHPSLAGHLLLTKDKKKLKTTNTEEENEQSKINTEGSLIKKLHTIKDVTIILKLVML